VTPHIPHAPQGVPGPDDHDVVSRLDRQHDDLVDGLDAVVDVAAGLREILLHSRHAGAVDGLDAVLDAEAGLAAILRPAGPVQREALEIRTPQSRPLNAEVRMRLRAHSKVVATYRGFGQARDLVRDFALFRSPHRERVLGRVLVLVLDIAQDVVFYFDPHGRRYDRDFFRALLSASALARRFALGFSVPDRDLTHDLDVIRSGVVDPDLGRALDLARIFARVLAHDRAFDPDRDSDELIDLYTNHLRRVIGAVLKGEPPPLDEYSVDDLLNDFTDSDLRTVDLTGIDLDGVRWSEHGTQWPSSMDIHNLRSRSEETPPGSGIYTIRSGTTTANDYADFR
jgi:hypothetical protein